MNPMQRRALREAREAARALDAKLAAETLADWLDGEGAPGGAVDRRLDACEREYRAWHAARA